MTVASGVSVSFPLRRVCRTIWRVFGSTDMYDIATPLTALIRGNRLVWICDASPTQPEPDAPNSKEDHGLGNVLYLVGGKSIQKKRGQRPQSCGRSYDA